MTQTSLVPRLMRAKLPLRWIRWIRNNPVILKEMRSRMRGWRSIVTLTAYIGALSGVIGMIYLGFSSSNNAIPSINVRKELGQLIFLTVYTMELIAVCLVSPSLTAGAISNEREHQTYDLLRTTLLSAPALVLGKLIAALAFVFLILFAAVPLQSIAFMFGGITLAEVLIGSLILVLTAIAFGSVGIFFSSIIRKTRVATVVSQTSALFFVIGVPSIVFFSLIIFDSRLNGLQNNLIAQILLFSLGWLFVATSPVATTIATELLLVNEQAIFYVQTSFPNGGGNVIIPSPWLGFIVLYPIFTFFLLFITIRRVRRAEK